MQSFRPFSRLSRPRVFPGKRSRVSVLLAAVVCAWPLPRLSAADVRSDVARLKVNDQHQDLRLYNLERDVGYLQKKVSYSPKAPSAQTSVSGKSPAASGKSPVLPPPAAASTYTVRSGDTLWRIAMNHRVSPGEIMQLNGMKGDAVKAGQTLRIPAKGAPAPSAAAASSSPSSSAKPPAPNPPPAAAAGGKTHVIAQGDTFSGIAQRYGVSQTALQQANPKVNPNVILIGSTLAIPAGAKIQPAAKPPPAPGPAQRSTAPPPSGSGQRHTVRSGDTLTSIAAANGVTAAALQHVNNITDPNRLSVGQQLIIPASGSKPANIVKMTGSSAPPPPYPGAGSTGGSGLQPTTAADKLSASAASAQPSPNPGPQPQANPRGILIYRVHSTDTIESIASTFGTTPQKIREINRKPAGSGVTADEEILVPALGAVGL